jgi:hypothetical protein
MENGTALPYNKIVKSLTIPQRGLKKKKLSQIIKA